MTPEEFVHELPPYANDAVKFKPPFEFKNLSLRVFPLRASLDALQQVCNNLLNIVPAEAGCFRAVAPYAYLALLDYGEIAETEQSVGWLAQTEVYFGVPVEWYQVVNGRWTFRDWGVITPFIFVDDDFSVPLGRMVFGYPKTLARMTRTASEWLRDPTSPVTLARVKTMVFPELYKGRPLESKVFLEVERDAPMSNVRLPLQAASQIAPWVIASRFAEAAAGFGRDAMSLAQSMRIFEPNPWVDPSFPGAMLNRLLPAFAPGGRGLALNSLNLKQFRNSSDPETICYQALTDCRMEILAFNAGGLLGEECVGLGDLTGGFTIKMHDYSSLPITRTLGLEVHRRWRGDGVDVLAFKPVTPFWANLNVKLLAGINLAWRTPEDIWRGANGAPLPSSQGPADPAAAPRAAPPFNTAVTSAVEDANVGPFEFTGTTIRVLPLLARRQALQEFLKMCINDAIGDELSSHRYRLSVWCRQDSEYAYVYMTVSSFGGVTSQTNNIGDWAKYELSFLIPVKWESEQSGEFKLEGVGLVPAFTFVDGTIAAISRNEVLGIPTLHAKFVRPPSVWLEEGREDLDTNQTLLQVDAEVYTALHAGQSAATYPLIEISARDFAGIGGPDSRATPPEWAEVLRSERSSKRTTKFDHPVQTEIARALALELLGNPSLTTRERNRRRGKPATGVADDRVPVSLYTLKQIRDVTDPHKACYQSLVRVPRIFDEVFDLREIDQTLRVRIHEFPSLRIVERLGIVAKTVRQKGAGIVYGTQPIRPFYVRATIHELYGECLLRRAGSVEWKRGDKVDSFLSDPRRPIKVDLQAERVQDDGDPCGMASIMCQSIERRKHRAEQPSADIFIRKEIDDPGAIAAVGKALEAETKKAEALEAETKKAKMAVIDDAVEDTTLTPNTVILRDLKRAFDELKAEAAPASSVTAAVDVSDELKDAAAPASSVTAAVDVSEVIGARIRGFLEDVQQWRLGKELTKQQAIKALHVVDPQMVIESILSREWGNLDAETKWRRGRAALQRARDNMLGVGSVPFAKFHLSPELLAKNVDAALEEALKAARKNFATIEQALYISVLHDQSTRPGWQMRAEQVTAMIENMGQFTECRLAMNDYFSLLAAWSIAPTLQDSRGWSPGSTDARPWFNDPAEVVRATNELLQVLQQISNTPVIGSPSEDDDPQVQADQTRLRQLLKVLNNTKEAGDLDSELTEGQSTKIEELFGGRPSDQVWLIDVVTQAVQLADRYCDVQRHALWNKLSKAYQKPDFCVRRDSVSEAVREKYFPRSESWDEDWY